MDASQMYERLDNIGLTDEEKAVVKFKIVGGSINPSGWSYVTDEDLKVNLKKHIADDEAKVEEDPIGMLK
jgi:hypothetical protein